MECLIPQAPKLYAALRVRAAFIAAALRARLPRFAELRLACPDTACRLALFLDSRFKAPEVARERFRAVLWRGLSPASMSCFAFFRIEDGPLGAFNFTPALRALESPMATACCGERAPCFPSRT